MDVQAALELVMDLARANALETSEIHGDLALGAERERQQEALDVAEDFILNVVGEGRVPTVTDVKCVQLDANCVVLHRDDAEAVVYTSEEAGRPLIALVRDTISALRGDGCLTLDKPGSCITIGAENLRVRVRRDCEYLTVEICDATMRYVLSGTWAMCAEACSSD